MKNYLHIIHFSLSLSSKALFQAELRPIPLELLTWAQNSGLKGLRLKGLQVDARKTSVTNTRLVIDLYGDNPQLYDKKSYKDHGSKAVTKTVLAAIEAKLP